MPNPTFLHQLYTPCSVELKDTQQMSPIACCAFLTRLVPGILTARLTSQINESYICVISFLALHSLYLPPLEESHQTGSSLVFSAHVAQLHRPAGACEHVGHPTLQSLLDLLSNFMQYEQWVSDTSASSQVSLVVLTYCQPKQSKWSGKRSSLYWMRQRCFCMASPSLFFSTLAPLSSSRWWATMDAVHDYNL